jgi:signal transduction histidine kinase
MTMGLFWQITAVEALLNVAIFVTGVIAYGFIRARALSHDWTGTQEQVAVGFLFGAATVLAALVPLHLDGGATIGAQSVLIALAAPISGNLAALLALAISTAAALGASSHVEAGATAVSLIALIAAAVAGFALRTMNGRLRLAPPLTYYQLPLLSLTSSLGALAGLAFVGGMKAAADSAIAAIGAGLVAMLVLGTLLLHEKRRHEAELGLRNSAASLRATNERLLAQTAELVAARDVAEQSSRAKSLFLANMSHELRTPLNAVIGFSQLIGQESDPVHSRCVDYAHDIQVGGEHLLGLISDILDFSKSEAKELDLEDEDVSLNAEIDLCLRLTRLQAEHYRVNVALEAIPAAYSIKGDRRRLRQIILNLLSNAIKFTLEDGSVFVSLESETDGGLVLVIRDTGIGIAKDDLEKVFEPFFQVDNQLSRLRGGTGLGLPLSKRLVELHGGRMQLKSELGVGTVVSATFPACRVSVTPLKNGAESAAAPT